MPKNSHHQLELSLLLISIFTCLTNTAFCQSSMPEPEMAGSSKPIYDQLFTTREYDYFEHDLRFIINDVKATNSIELELHESASDCNLDADSLITLKTKKVSLLTMLSLIAELYGCTVTIKDGKLQIIAIDEAEDADLMLEWRFDVNDLANSQMKGDRLLAVITSTIEFDSWAENGGEAVASFDDGQLKVKQTLVNLVKIRDLLQKLHQVAVGK